MRPGDDPAACQRLHFLQRHIHALFPEKVHDAELPLVPAGTQLAAERCQGGALRAEVQAEYVHVPVLGRPQLHAAQHCKAQGRARLDRLLGAVNGVVVGDRQHLDAGGGSLFHQRRRRILPIRRGGVGVEVCQDGHAFISLRMATIRITGGSSFP